MLGLHMCTKFTVQNVDGEKGKWLVYDHDHQTQKLHFGFLLDPGLIWIVLLRILESTLIQLIETDLIEHFPGIDSDLIEQFMYWLWFDWTVPVLTLIWLNRSCIETDLIEPFPYWL